MAPFIPDALGIENWLELSYKLMLIGVVVSFIFSVILALIYVFWKDKTKVEVYVLNERGELCPYNKVEE
jgi:small basic protein